MKVEFFISGNVPSSKNSKQWTGRALIWSKSARKYVKDTESQWIKLAPKFRLLASKKEKPLRIHFKFFRGSRHKFDYPNPLQTTLDLMVRYDWIDDDNADEVIPVFEVYEYDKENPGVEIWLEN